MIGALYETNVRYDILTKLLDDKLNSIIYSNNVNIIIDLKSIYKKAYRTDINSTIQNEVIAIEDISSHVLNMIGHYRNYFYKNDKYTTFYILYSKTECKELLKDYPEYKKYYYDKYFNNKDEFKTMNNIIKSSTKQIQTVCKYLPNVYFIDTSLLDEALYCNYLIRNIVNDNDMNILLSNDPILYQMINKNTFILDIKGENSSLISDKEVVKYLIKKDTNISCNLLNIILSITGDENYTSEKIEGLGYKKAVKILEGLVNNNKLVDKTYIGLPEELFNNEILNTNRSIIEKNFNIVYPIGKQLINTPILSTSFQFVKPKISFQQLSDMNRYFSSYPLNIYSLIKGEQL